MSRETISKVPERIVNLCTSMFNRVDIFQHFSALDIEKCKDIFSNKQLLRLLNDEDLINTARVFFDHDLNISSASKTGYMHRNTLVYRLDKIKKIIGLDIRHFNEAVLFQNMINCFTFIKDNQL
ncbi:MAG: helix-turn-helix domain-containing protein [Clostridia bacterium]|nr:helix-turn-helix domain-containing protein [Clostridia bacterium]